ncbi:LppU/SCO3897 family protein [Mycobacteroides abscessus]|uniref:LppU/SCO3897 family protein n=1 Tax=Mycobacteroides abscessus TaxID=36809 RepID=UPI0005E259EC|nr:hypothetical protein [Mycobacteroides abscessus]CPS05599.1 Conserved hypothetical protein (lipoprotein LppU?) [Mycobacteroides abscessus]CPS17610.1 Conserved hypothetical protein (lipoprotein LppU?) [Mycobacteroides abscessus]CPS22758.1 Conserved hypothetical protein (lipoprotein LppU?) [Mycobacteroides abscessus]CPS90644.1 Conserved hypothetical protein (lipoprotein LppU?) [Mycobacteroides abscessus]CPT45589.1 Conserved hypothetical protein (lipoprotein LppU?) [Mycobacteroides abscessus]
MNSTVRRVVALLQTLLVAIGVILLYRILILHRDDNDWLIISSVVILAITLPFDVIRFRSGEGRLAKWLQGRRIWFALALTACVILIGYGLFNSLKFSAVMHEVEQSHSSSAPFSSSTDFTQIMGQYPTPEQIETTKGLKASVGSCVNLSGPQGSPTLTEVECGSAENNYRVIQRVAMPSECVADADRRYYHNGVSDEWTVCLDLAWSSNSCLSVQRDSVSRVACDDTSKPSREKPLKILFDNTTTSDNCPSGGFAHPVRKFTVCTETQKP